MFILQTSDDMAYLLLYVDDIILTTSSIAMFQQVISKMSNEFVMTDLGVLNYFMGISTVRSTTGLFLS